MESDLLINSINKEGYVASSDKGVTVVLDTNLTEELIAEGLVREFVSKIQALRKESDFVVTDHVKIECVAQGQVKQAIENHKTQIMGDTLCDQLTFVDSKNDDVNKELDINGSSVFVKISKI